MSGPIETTGLLLVAGAAFCAALFIVPLPKPKPAPTPPASERLTDSEHVSRVAPVIAPAPPPPLETEDERIIVLEQDVYEIKRDQKELKEEIRALTRELEDK